MVWKQETIWQMAIQVLRAPKALNRERRENRRFVDVVKLADTSASKAFGCGFKSHHRHHADVVQWQNPSLPSWWCGFDSRYLLQRRWAYGTKITESQSTSNWASERNWARASEEGHFWIQSKDSWPMHIVFQQSSLQCVYCGEVQDSWRHWELLEALQGSNRHSERSSWAFKLE